MPRLFRIIEFPSASSATSPASSLALSGSSGHHSSVLKDPRAFQLPHFLIKKSAIKKDTIAAVVFFVSTRNE